MIENKNKDRGDKFARYGWTLSEANLKTLPDDAPPGGKRLAEWVAVYCGGQKDQHPLVKDDVRLLPGDDTA